ncbi:PREDICTED: gastrula zinc finger protein XlCGF66.1-like [Nanorana parkeri]|uniref:gastrula zinc finger protein XlCGF66.1-like n=1 Tax=Nanorana parkeri TaxID=125878 RepID=UPI000854C3D7|nr:PREDICTED: gastrula zinc finger protein XlCGF66.1-like [Nanorana parkeri]
MEKERGHMTETILNLTMEIIYLLTGENYIAFKMTDGLVTPKLRKALQPVLEPPSQALQPESDNDKKIQEVTSKIIELLTGEVPIRCQDVSVYLSKEERGCLEEYKDMYKDVVMENQPPLTSPESRGSAGSMLLALMLELEPWRNPLTGDLFTHSSMLTV